MAGSVYLHVGCGHVAPASWMNFDGSPTLRLERLPLVGRFVQRNRERFPANVRYGDIVKGLPVAPGSAAAVYASHILEHLSLEGCRQAIRNIYSYLAPGGVFRVIVPDMEFAIHEYLAALESNPRAGVTMITNLGVGKVHRSTGLKRRILDMYGNSGHLWAWDYASLAGELADAGFKNIRRCAYHDAADPKFQDVEWDGRFEPGNLPIECQK